MLNSRNNGKMLTGYYHNNVEGAARNELNYLPSELEFLEHTGDQQGIVGRMDYFDIDMNMNVHPVDMYSDDKVSDYRRVTPEVGDPDVVY